ncbi:DUF5700 domain-containing putative Zn-dependent protease [Dokdonella sp.]|uniref:DUF5700 domain-containing putative Zn-dependent protease n=1 Tax=Dokdonella sp. TaxID=2291710 RepID=UPI003C54328B
MVQAAILFVALAATPGADANIAVRVDTEFARDVLAEVCSNQGIDDAAIRRSAVVNTMVDHFAQFRDDFTMDAYVEARRLAAECKSASKDIFRFAQVIEERESLAREIKTIHNSQAGYSSAIAGMLSDYTPAGVKFSGAATLVIGSPSCGGWSKAADFYVDVPCVKSDEAGLQYLIAHETYHAIQNLFMPETPQSPSLAVVLNGIIREGSAMVVADHSTIEKPGAYSEHSLRIARTNKRRMKANFELLDVSAFYLAGNDRSDAARVIDTIGLSGFYDSPFYSVGAAMTRSIDSHLGREALLCLMQAPAQEFFAAYASLPESEQAFRLGPHTLAGVQGLRSDASRTQGHACLSGGNPDQVATE